jgi:hypothetical protein
MSLSSLVGLPADLSAVSEQASELLLSLTWLRCFLEVVEVDPSHRHELLVRGISFLERWDGRGGLQNLESRLRPLSVELASVCAHPVRLDWRVTSSVALMVLQLGVQTRSLLKKHLGAVHRAVGRLVPAGLDLQSPCRGVAEDPLGWALAGRSSGEVQQAIGAIDWEAFCRELLDFRGPSDYFGLSAELEIELAKVAMARGQRRTTDGGGKDAVAASESRGTSNRLCVEGRMVYLDGRPVPLGLTPETTDDALAFLSALLNEPGNWKSGRDIGKETKREGVRFDRVLKKLPDPIKSHIESDRRKGYRLAHHPWRK